MWLQSGNGHVDCQEEKFEVLWSRSQRWWIGENGIVGGRLKAREEGGGPKNK